VNIRVKRRMECHSVPWFRCSIDDKANKRSHFSSHKVQFYLCSFSAFLFTTRISKTNQSPTCCCFSISLSESYTNWSSFLLYIPIIFLHGICFKLRIQCAVTDPPTAPRSSSMPFGNAVQRDDL